MGSSSSLLLLCIFLFLSSVFSSKIPPHKLQGLRDHPELRGNTKPTAPPRFKPLDMSACPAIPVPPDATNVNSLRPGNIKVVMAMGDSITAGVSAKDTSVFGMKEYRGLAFSMGGDSGVTTMPNILKYYTGTGLPIGPSLGIGERNRPANGLNAAVSGAINTDMLSQAQWLVTQAKANPNIDFENDWKLLTIWIGSNNLCDVCDKPLDNNADNFSAKVTLALEYLFNNMPRVFVNLLVNLDITQLDDIKEGMCGFLHSVACSCVTSNRQVVYDYNLQYQVKAYNIAQNFSSRNNPEFTVVVQPFLEQTYISKRSELSAADCFHPSAASHAVAAVALWNNMITPAAEKKRAWTITDKPLCADADTLLYTN